MDVRLTKPELEEFVDQKVKSGDFATPEAVVEDALERMMEEEIALSDEDIAAINQAEGQIDCGESVDFETFADQTRRKYGLK